MGQMFLGVHKYKQAFCGPKGFSRRMLTWGKLPFIVILRTPIKRKKQGDFVYYDEALWLLYIPTVVALKIS